MQVQIVEGIEGVRMATGVVVVIDVLRAFTTAAYAFNAGIAEIELVSTVEDAFATTRFRMGEVGGGRLIPGFDHNNSPITLVGRQLSVRAVMRRSQASSGRCGYALEDVNCAVAIDAFGFHEDAPRCRMRHCN